MKRYSVVIIVHICLLIVFSISTYWLYQIHLWFSTLIAFLCLLATSIHLYCMQIKQLKMIHQLTESLCHNDMTQAFHTPYKNKLITEISQNLSEALQLFHNRLVEEEVKHQYYENLLNKVDTAVLVTDMSGCIEWMNQAAISLLGEKPLLPLEISSLSPESTQVVRVACHGVIQEIVVATTLFVARSTKRKLISLKNIHAVLEQNEMDAWQKLIRVLTHEIMNSITPIISLSETLSERDIPATLTDLAEHKEYVSMWQAMQTIHRRSKGLLDFVENYRKLTRLPAPDLRDVSVCDLLIDLQKLFSDGSIHIELPFSDRMLKIDRSQIEQVLINLLKNAREACVHQDVPIIEVKTTFSSKSILALSPNCTISITDNGEGILPEVQDKIFVPFFTTKVAGSGIGLSLCKQIMNQHGGNITVQSEVGKGSCFTLQFNLSV